MSLPFGHIKGDSHIFAVRVYYEDTDAGGVVYHARYLHFLERARTEMMRCLGCPHAQMGADRGVLFTVRRAELDYLRPARLEEALAVQTRILEIRGARVEIEQTVVRAGDRLVQAKISLACVTMAGRPARLPAEVGDVLAALMAGRLSSAEPPPKAAEEIVGNVKE